MMNSALNLLLNYNEAAISTPSDNVSIIHRYIKLIEINSRCYVKFARGVLMFLLSVFHTIWIIVLKRIIDSTQISYLHQLIRIGWLIHESVTKAVIGSVNSSKPGDAYMCHWNGPSLVQIMACQLFGGQPLPEQVLTDCELDFTKKMLWKLNRNPSIFVEENTF